VIQAHFLLFLVLRSFVFYVVMLLGRPGPEVVIFLPGKETKEPRLACGKLVGKATAALAWL
jgi:hypothetical protein